MTDTTLLQLGRYRLDKGEHVFEANEAVYYVWKQGKYDYRTYLFASSSIYRALKHALELHKKDKANGHAAR